MILLFLTFSFLETMHTMKCYKCGFGLAKVALFRINEKGTPGIFGCSKCISSDKQPDVDVETIVSIIEKENKITH